jgi:anti-anti-sigma factor
VGGGPRDDLAVLAVQYRSREVDVKGVGDETWSISIPSTPEALALAQQCIGGILRARQVPDPIIHDCSLAVEEVLTNIVRHAYGGNGEGKIDIELRLRPEGVRLRVVDTGPLFNPLEQRLRNPDVPLAERPLGGHGIILVKGLVDECEYAREGETNVLTLHWARPAQPADHSLPELMNQPTRGGGDMALHIEITSQGKGRRRVTLQGRLDTVTAPKLDEELAPVLDARDVTSLVFQLYGLEYISSAGIRCLVRARKALAARGGEVVIVDPQPGVRKVFEIVKALPSDQVFANEAELDAYLDAMQRKANGPS